jgi:type IV pilus assembly protein PilA
MKQGGFTLIELMMVVAIIGILAAAAIPAYSTHLKQARVAEALQLVSAIQATIADYYAHIGAFPADNDSAGLPPPTQLRGSYVESITVENGAIHLSLHEPENFGGAFLSLRPAVAPVEPSSGTLLWQCGYVAPLPDLHIFGENNTDIAVQYLPPSCK